MLGLLSWALKQSSWFPLICPLLAFLFPRPPWQVPTISHVYFLVPVTASPLLFKLERRKRGKIVRGGAQCPFGSVPMYYNSCRRISAGSKMHVNREASFKEMLGIRSWKWHSGSYLHYIQQLIKMGPIASQTLNEAFEQAVGNCLW